MKTLEEIRNEIAKENGYKDWDDLHDYYVEINSPFNIILEQVVKRYALEAIKSDRKKIIDAKMHICEIDDITQPMLEDHQKEIILNLPIELK